MAVEAPLKPRNVSWYSWSSAKYWQLSDKLSASADSNRVWSSITRSLNLNSKGLALGLAEGTIIFKATAARPGALFGERPRCRSTCPWCSSRS